MLAARIRATCRSCTAACGATALEGQPPKHLHFLRPTTYWKCTLKPAGRAKAPPRRYEHEEFSPEVAPALIGKR